MGNAGTFVAVLQETKIQQGASAQYKALVYKSETEKYCYVASVQYVGVFLRSSIPFDVVTSLPSDAALISIPS